MRLTPCSCDAAHRARMRRRWWMRVFFTRRLYHCYACGDALLLPLAPQRASRLNQSAGM